MFYNVSEPELDTVSIMNTGTIVFFSIGSFCLQNVIATKDFSWVSLLDPNVLATIFFFIAGIYTLLTGKSVVKKIKDGHIMSRG